MEGTARGMSEGPRSRAVAGALLAAVLASAGCTICPDPFDYSGPVPDGSPPQNDFRARAGGILPLGAAPRPWPPIVKDVGRPDEMPVIADEEPEEPGAVVSEKAATELRQTSVLVPEPGDSDAGGVHADADEEPGAPKASPAGLLPIPSAAAAPDLAITDEDGTGGTVPVADPGVGGPPTAGTVEPPAREAKVPSPAVAAPSSDPRESPGWRPRRRPTR